MLKIASYELPAFRGAIIDKIGREDSLLFHNHLDDKKYSYRYPLVQYKTVGKRPTLLCLHEAVEEIHKFFGQRDWSIRISDRTLEMKIANLELNNFNMQVWDRNFDYSIHHWIALDQKAYADYQALAGMGERIAKLESILVGNMIAFAKGIGWTLPPKEERPLNAKIISMEEPKWVSVKGNKVLAFDMHFKTNAFLPSFVGLGKHVSLGFGLVKAMR